VHPEHLGRAPVGEADLDATPLADDMQAGGHQPTGINDEAGADALLGPVAAAAIDPDNGRAGLFHQPLGRQPRGGW